MEQNLAEGLVDGLRAAGINFITYLPETRLSEIIPILQSDSSFHMVPVSSEAEGVSIAAGAALGGKIVASYMEGTGVYVSCYNILTVGVRYGVPMLLLVSYVGSLEDRRNSFLYVQRGTRLIPQLEALGVQYQVIRNGDGLEHKIKDAVRMMNALKQPVALLFTEDFTI
ncbi:MAG: thiamine pyrophosphate-binding protein [Candidatus Binatia bacterium]